MELERGWEKFRGGPYKAVDDRLHVSLNQKGMLLINSTTYRLMGRPAAVTLYYNREEDKVAVEPADIRLAEAYPVRDCKTHHRVHAISFCRHFGIRFAFTHKMLNPEITEERRLILDLRDTTPVFTKKQLRTGKI